MYPKTKDIDGYSTQETQREDGVHTFKILNPETTNLSGGSYIQDIEYIQMS